MREILSDAIAYWEPRRIPYNLVLTGRDSGVGFTQLAAFSAGIHVAIASFPRSIRDNGEPLLLRGLFRRRSIPVFFFSSRMAPLAVGSMAAWDAARNPSSELLDRGRDLSLRRLIFRRSPSVALARGISALAAHFKSLFDYARGRLA